MQKEALDLYNSDRLEKITNETTELVECYLCNWISLENAATSEKHLFGENCETANERTVTGFGETCGTIEIRRSIFDIPYSEIPYHDMKNSVHRWDVKMTLRVTSSFEVDNDFLLKTCSMDDSLCVFDCEDDLCNHSGYDGYPDDGRFMLSKTTIPKRILQSIHLKKSTNQEEQKLFKIEEDIVNRQLQWCHICKTTFSGDELVQNTDCMEITEDSIALPIVDYNCATQMDRQKYDNINPNKSIIDDCSVLYRNNWYDVWNLERTRSSYFYSQNDVIDRYSNYDLVATGESAFDRRQVPCAENYCNNISGWEILEAFPGKKLFEEDHFVSKNKEKEGKSPPDSCFVCQEVLVNDSGVLESVEGDEDCVILNDSSAVESITTEHRECGVTESWGYARKKDGTIANLSSAERRIVSWGDPSPVN